MIRTFIIREFIGNLDARRRRRANLWIDLDGSRPVLFENYRLNKSGKKFWAGSLASFRKRKPLGEKSPIV